MVSFRADDHDVDHADQWAKRLGIDRSQLLRNALHRHLFELCAEQENAAYTRHPFTASETALAHIADWGPSEDWTAWANTANSEDEIDASR